MKGIGCESNDASRCFTKSLTSAAGKQMEKSCKGTLATALVFSIFRKGQPLYERNTNNKNLHRKGRSDLFRQSRKPVREATEGIVRIFHPKCCSGLVHRQPSLRVISVSPAMKPRSDPREFFGALRKQQHQRLYYGDGLKPKGNKPGFFSGKSSCIVH